MKLQRRAIAALAVAAGLTGVVGVPAAVAATIPTAAEFQSGAWDLQVGNLTVSYFSDPNFGTDLALIAGTGSSRLIYDRSTDAAGNVDFFTVQVGGTCYVGCRTGHAGVV